MKHLVQNTDKNIVLARMNLTCGQAPYGGRDPSDLAGHIKLSSFVRSVRLDVEEVPRVVPTNVNTGSSPKQDKAQFFHERDMAAIARLSHENNGVGEVLLVLLADGFPSLKRKGAITVLPGLELDISQCQG